MCSKKIFGFMLFLLICITAYFVYPENEIKYQPGVLVESQPEQILIKKPEPWMKDEFTITPMAEFHVKARVLSYENYRLGKESEISPLDLALGWGPMSDQVNLDQIEIKQRNRWYYWKTKSLPTPQNIIISNSANMHIIPANIKIDAALNGIKRGSLIELSGYLVTVKADKGWTWKSSLSRNDSGDGACEIFWVDDFTFIN